MIYLNKCIKLMQSVFSSRGGGPLLGICALLLLGACASERGGPIAYEVPTNFQVPDAPRAANLGADYRIATGDMLGITVFRVEAMSKDYRVDPSGTIAFPLIGDVAAVGLTTSELRTELATRLGARFIRNPDVSVSIKESTNNHVTVEGGVRRPGLFPVTGPMTLIQSVALAGGIDPQQGNAHRLAIFRRIEGQRVAAAFDLISIRRGEMQDPEIFPGDIIVVESNSRRGLFQDVLQALPLLAIFRPF